MDKKKLIGLRIRTMRKSRKMTQTDLAQAIDHCQTSIAMYEAGKREPDFETLEALADVFNVPLNALIADEDPVPAPPPVIRIATTCEAEEIASTVDALSPAERLRALNVFRAMFPRTDKPDQEE